MLRFLPTAARVAGPALVAALLFAGSASAQTAHRSSTARKTAAVRVLPATKPVAPAAVKEAAPGTYQLVRLTNKVNVSISSDALTEIERRRQETDEVSWLISPYAKVRILPRRVISAADFKPLEPIANAY
jgi:hypothetical protein